MMPFLVVVLYFIFSFQVKYDLEIFLIRYLNQTMNDTTKQLNDFFFFFTAINNNIQTLIQSHPRPFNGKILIFFFSSLCF